MSRGALEALFQAGAGDDSGAVAEAKGRADLALLVPEARDLLVELLEFGGHFGVAAIREAVPEPDAAFAQPLDLVSDVMKSAHDRDKRGREPTHSRP